MHTHKKRKLRFSYSDFVVNSLDSETDSQFESSTKSFKDVIIHDPSAESQGAIQLDSASQAQLAAMAQLAKANGGNSSGLDMDYLTKISAGQHNQITMAIAGDKIKELKINMNEEIQKNSGDTTTADILNETATDHIIYKDYDASKLDQYIEKISSMTMLEAVSLKNSIAKELNRLESCNTMIKAVADLRQNFDVVAPGKTPTMLDRKNAGCDVDKQILAANYLDDYGYSESAEEFTNLYEQYQPKLTELSNALEAHIAECSSKAASTKYMTEDFLHIINKRLDNLSPSDQNYAYLFKSLSILKDAFEHRTEFKVLYETMNCFIQNKTHLKKLAKALKGTFSDIASKLNSNFGPTTMSAFIKFANDCFDQDMYKVLSLLYFLNYVCVSEAKHNGDAWVKVFVLNINDISKGIWDLDLDSNDYKENANRAFNTNLNKINLYLKKRKIHISSQIQSQYMHLLNTETNSIEHVDAEEVGVVDSPIDTVVDTETIPVQE